MVFVDTQIKSSSSLSRYPCFVQDCGLDYLLEIPYDKLFCSLKPFEVIFAGKDYYLHTDIKIVLWKPVIIITIVHIFLL